MNGSVGAGLEGNGHLSVTADVRDVEGHAALIARSRAELGSFLAPAAGSATIEQGRAGRIIQPGSQGRGTGGFGCVASAASGGFPRD